MVLKEGHKTTEEEIIAFYRDNIAHYKAPKSVDLIKELPKTGSGKIYKKGLRDQYCGEIRGNRFPDKREEDSFLVEWLCLRFILFSIVD